MLRMSLIRRHAAPLVRGPNDSRVKHYAKMGWEVLRHLYHGFKLFYLNTKLAWRYSRQMQSGVALTRRERLLLESATMDLLRLVPFSFFIIVPFAELLLPVALKMFPGLIPSTFETEEQGRTKAFRSAMQTLLARQRLTEYMTSTLLASHKDHSELLRRVASGDSLNPKQIRAIAPLCGRDGPLSINRLPPSVLTALARTTGVYHPMYAVMPQRWKTPRLRKAIKSYYYRMKSDDLQLDAEGIESLTPEERIKANQMRGMRWTESPDTLLVQLEWWVALAKDPKVPYNTLYWLKPTRYHIRKTMEGLPVEERRRLLGIQHLPGTVRTSLEQLCETVDSGKNNRGTLTGESEDADSIAQHVEEISSAAESGGKDLEVQNAKQALGSYLTEANVKRIYEEIRAELPPTKEVKVSDVTERLGPDVGLSTHIISNIFDAFDFGKGSKAMTEASLLSIGARCRDGASTATTTTAAAAGASATSAASAKKSEKK